MLNLFKRWRKSLPSRIQVRQLWFFQAFGRTLFHPDLWSFGPRQVAGGVALGLFVACTPTLGIQMLIVAALAVFIRVNLPLGLAATWITNVATAPFFYYLCYKVGLVLLGGEPSPHAMGSFSGRWRAFVQMAKPLWVGSIFVGALLAALGYLLAMLIWSLHGRLIRTKRPSRFASTQGSSPSTVQRGSPSRDLQWSPGGSGRH